MPDSRPMRAGPWRAAVAALLALTAAPAPPAAAQAQRGAAPATAAPAPPLATFADFAAMVEQADIVALVEVRDQAEVEPERAPGLAAGQARLYVEARTQALLAGRPATRSAKTMKRCFRNLGTRPRASSATSVR